MKAQTITLLALLSAAGCSVAPQKIEAPAAPVEQAPAIQQPQETQPDCDSWQKLNRIFTECTFNGALGFYFLEDREVKHQITFGREEISSMTEKQIEDSIELGFELGKRWLTEAQEESF